MAYRTDRTFLESDHTIKFRRHATRHIETEYVSELIYGVSLEITAGSHRRILYPLFLKISEIHPIQQIHRCGPCDILKQFHRHAYRHSMLHAILQIVKPSWSEVKTVSHANIILRISGIADIHILIPSLLRRVTYIFKRIHTIHGKRDFRQSNRHDTSESVLAMASVSRKIEETAYSSLIRNT